MGPARRRVRRADIPADRRGRPRPVRQPRLQATSTSPTAARAPISVLDFATDKLIAKWRIPGGGSPDMGGVSADGRSCGCPAATTPRSTPSTPPTGAARPQDPGRRRPARPVPSGRSPAATPSATPASCADWSFARPGCREYRRTVAWPLADRAQRTIPGRTRAGTTVPAAGGTRPGFARLHPRSSGSRAHASLLASAAGTHSRRRNG